MNEYRKYFGKDKFSLEKRADAQEWGVCASALLITLNIVFIIIQDMLLSSKEFFHSLRQSQSSYLQ